ncbi:uncharacterized protein LOC101864460 [Aplysia californica]|uniref:Uncharacterized protein LOC101864460 n=1 Tax=Aplysia californica TaxID=6500 RepID=A0ABM0ZZG1_APLCA|nr:uncharacterized protein LOC101864460 [Aplysia californica]
MATGNSSDPLSLISSDLDPELHLALTIVVSIALVGSLVAVATKLTFRYVIPVGWKCCLLLHDAACLLLSLGLLLASFYVDGASQSVCKAAGFFTLFGLLDLTFAPALLGLTLVLIQNPSKMSQLSVFRWAPFLGLVIPEKILVCLLSVLPVMPIEYFDGDSPYPLVCFPVRQEGDNGATFGAILFFIAWSVVGVAIILQVANAVRFWAGPGTRIHASSPSIWQMQKMEQGRTLHKFSLLDTSLTVVMMFVMTIVVYTNSLDRHTPQWIALLTAAGVVIGHTVVSMIQLAIWSSLCCDKTDQKKEPHHRLKQLELIRIEGPGKLRLRASWTAGKGVWRRGLLKVYGPAHIKAWAQEIVVLGLLRKSQSASVLQCLWTSNSNPYYETMTLISGDIVTSDSRLTCLEMTSSSTLCELLKTMDVPLPEPCQKTIMHDIAEGLSYLHDQNVLHRNLSSAAVYLKGSVQCLVLRAAVGDFEDAQIYGTLLTGTPNSSVSRKRFFYPDIRAYALVGLEMLGRVCECRQKERQPYRRTTVKVSSTLKEQASHFRKPHHHHGHPTDSHAGAVSGGGGGHLGNRSRGGRGGNLKEKQPVGVKRFEEPEVAYCVPGEAEYLVPRVLTKAEIAEASKTSKLAMGDSEEEAASGSAHRTAFADSQAAEYDIDKNWKLRAKTTGASGTETSSDWIGKDSDCDDYKPHEDRFSHSQIPGITHVRGAHTYEFPNHSVFHSAGIEGEDLDMIEEEIERDQHIRLVAKNGVYKQGGYVTSQTEDGREIFIPAGYTTKKSSGGSSSGYGSYTGSEQYCTPGEAVGAVGLGNVAVSGNSELRQVHKTTSAATISSFEDDALPGIADVDEKPKRGEQLLRELLKARQDAKVEQLIEMYEERVRRGELAPNLEGLPIGVVFPKKNKQHALPSGHQPDDGSLEAEVYEALKAMYNSQNPSNKPSSSSGTSSSPRPKTASAAMSQKLQRNPSRPMSATNSSFHAWNARSSLKRNKARVALKKALSFKGSTSRPVSASYDAARGSRGKEVEMKYSSRPCSAMSHSAPTQPDDAALWDQTSQDADVQLVATSADVGHPDYNNDQNTTLSTVQDVQPKTTDTTQSAAAKSAASPPVIRKPSSKSKPAPAPPPIPPKPFHRVSSPETVLPSSPPHPTDRVTSPKTVKPALLPKPAQPLSPTKPVQPESSPETTQPVSPLTLIRPTSPSHPSQTQSPSKPVQPVSPSRTVTTGITSSIVTTNSSVPTTSIPNNNDVTHTHHDQRADPSHSPVSRNDSFTSCEPASTESTSTQHNSSSSTTEKETTNIDKIQSEMNNIIQSNTSAAATSQAGGKGLLPPGIRLIDSGFDSASVSSEESCLCAAAALQAVEDESCSCPSEIFSQGTCSCACSNCLSVNRGDNVGSSWTESQDSETWSNSNSFSSYDANMHRRKLPSIRRDSSGCILAPDEQYPSPVHRRPGKVNSPHKLSPNNMYSPKRNRRHLRPTKGHNTSSASETSSAASRRYRELVKKGVPLRVSVISGDSDGNFSGASRIEARNENAENPQYAPNSASDTSSSRQDENNALLQDLESQGFFEKNTKSPLGYRPSYSDDYDDEDGDERFQGLSPIPSLEEIIKEIPDETGNYSEETKAFLNRPESELSVKALQAVLSRHGSATDDGQFGNPELIIDRIFSHNAPHDLNLSHSGVEPGCLELDEAAIREVAMLPSGGISSEAAVPPDMVGLLSGMDGRHIRYCHSISSRVHLINMGELIPASAHSFDQLKTRLQHTGSIGIIGNQILELIRTCWLNEAPPSTASIVDQLTDHITETEL